jgi:hypothetical protein
VLLHIISDDKLCGHVIVCEDAHVWRLEICFYCFGLVPNVILVAYVIVKSSHDELFGCCFSLLICLNHILWECKLGLETCILINIQWLLFIKAY